MAGQDDWRNPAVLARILRYGDTASRQVLADAIADGFADLVPMLAATARSQEDMTLRARCLEVLGRSLSNASPELTRLVLAAVLDSPAIHA